MDKIYDKDKQAAIVFPLGGIGSGGIGLAGNGRLVDFELFNRPNKETTNGYSHFAIKCETKEKVIDARVLQGDTVREFNGSGKGHHHSWGFGHGPNRTTLAGMPHFEDVTFCGGFPFAVLKYKDARMPADIAMEAFNPFIPMNDKDSSIPAAFFTFEIKNNYPEELKYTVAFSAGNVFKRNTVNEFIKTDSISSIVMRRKGALPHQHTYGNMAISTDAEDVAYQEYWYRSGWFDELTMFWKDFSRPGSLANRHYDTPGNRPRNLGSDTATLTASVTIKPGETKRLRFVLSWYIPNFYMYWGNNPRVIWGRAAGFLTFSIGPTWKNYYTKLFSGSLDAAEYCFKHFERLQSDTRMFKDALHGSSLPPAVLDAVQGNIAILKSSTCMRLSNGEFYAFEGSNYAGGSCEGTCNHVWNYAYALPFLFPKLERSIRELDYKYNLKKSGAVGFRLQLPLGSRPSDFRPCADGQFGGVIKVYREWKLCGDDNWLRGIWPGVKKSLEYAWSDQNDEYWDREKNGYLVGSQHHTLDMELFGPNSWLTGLYLGALKAAAVMAAHLGEQDKAKEYDAIFKKGCKWMEANLFNGRHYIQKINLKDKSLLEKYCTPRHDVNRYWNDERGEIKYQIGEGCEIDQVVAQWHATLNGLGDIFDKENRKTALRTLYETNFRRMRDVFNPCRIFALDDEKGLLICNWTEGAYKPLIPVPYTEEVMCGFEYAAACTMLQEGMEREALEIVAAVRERYDGYKRNPWSEIECGASYARSMASYSLLLTYSGFVFDMTAKTVGFKPLHFENGYRTFWSVDNAWGVFAFNGDEITLDVLYGELPLRTLILPDGVAVTKASVKNEDAAFTEEGGVLHFSQELALTGKLTLKIRRN